MDRTLADSQELLIAISKSYSFPGMHYVTSEEEKRSRWSDTDQQSHYLFSFPFSLPSFLSNVTPGVFTETEHQLCT